MARIQNYATMPARDAGAGIARGISAGLEQVEMQRRRALEEQLVQEEAARKNVIAQHGMAMDRAGLALDQGRHALNREKFEQDVIGDEHARDMSEGHLGVAQGNLGVSQDRTETAQQGQDLSRDRFEYDKGEDVKTRDWNERLFAEDQENADALNADRAAAQEESERRGAFDRKVKRAQMDMTAKEQARVEANSRALRETVGSVLGGQPPVGGLEASAASIIAAASQADQLEWALSQYDPDYISGASSYPDLLRRISDNNTARQYTADVEKLGQDVKAWAGQGAFDGLEFLEAHGGLDPESGDFDLATAQADLEKRVGLYHSEADWQDRLNGDRALIQSLRGDPEKSDGLSGLDPEKGARLLEIQGELRERELTPDRREYLHSELRYLADPTMQRFLDKNLEEHDAQVVNSKAAEKVESMAGMFEYSQRIYAIDEVLEDGTTIQGSGVPIQSWDSVINSEATSSTVESGDQKFSLSQGGRRRDRFFVAIANASREVSGHFGDPAVEMKGFQLLAEEYQMEPVQLRAALVLGRIHQLTGIALSPNDYQQMMDDAGMDAWGTAIISTEEERREEEKAYRRPARWYDSRPVD